ncbi:MAG: hypothetical protein Q9160_008941 [Pyrenula sp. 1 TL-2023]
MLRLSEASLIVVLGRKSSKISEGEIRDDLTAGKGLPKWIFTSYAPEKNSPASLLPDNELSPEELRFRFYNDAAATNPEQANNEALKAYKKCESDIKEVLSNTGRIRTFYEEKEKEHPNRYDFCAFDGTKSIEQFIEGLKADNSAFGRSTTFSQTSQGTGGFGKPAFGQSSQPPQMNAAFGKPTFGQPPPSTGFGQSGFGQSSFGQSSFGRPAFGQPAQPSTSFGQAGQSSKPGTSFGQPSQPSTTFGQASQPNNPFSQATSSTNNQSSGVFGKPAGSGFGQSGFGQSGFGKPTFGQTAPSTSGFGQSTGGFGSQPTTFGQPTQPPTGTSFGQAAKPSTGPGFGQSPFGRSANFGASNQRPAASNPFGQPGPSSSTTANTPFGQQSQQAPPGSMTTTTQNAMSTTTHTSQSSATTPYVGRPSNGPSHPLTGSPPAVIHSSQELPKITPQNTTYTGSGPNRRLVKWRGRPVKYDEDDKPCYERAGGKGLERIWFPEGKDTAGLATQKKEELEGPAEAYTEEVVKAFEYLYKNGEFDPDKPVPTVPPKREWLTADF